MEGSTEIEFRNVFAKHFYGIDAAVAPFVSLTHHEANERRRTWDIPPFGEQQMKTIPQFMGRNIKDFRHLVQWVKQKGYDELNWNLGCPVKRVIRRGRGCGMLKYPDEIKLFLDEVFNNNEINFSIKTRLGLEEADECFKLLEIYNQYPIKEIVLHPRTGKQSYRGEVMLDYFAAFLRLSKHEIVYNGDINTVDDYLKIKKMFPSVSRIMIGRGLLKDPFLAEKIKDFQTKSKPRIERFINFHQDLFNVLEIEFREKSELLGRMKGYWHYFSHLFNNRDEVFKSISRSKNLEEYHARVDEMITLI